MTDALRDKFDGFYDLIKPMIFETTKKNPEFAHHLFFWALKGMGMVPWLSGAVLDNSANEIKNNLYTVSNGAGFYKNAEINPRLMKLLGFDNVVVGTVTGDPWKGNKFRPRIWRFPDTGSLVNCMGLPGIGAKKIARRLERYGDHGVPLTINLMATPDPKMNYADKLRDLEKTVMAFRNNPYVCGFELNISCPNTHGSDGKRDARQEYASQLDGMLDTVRRAMKLGQSLYLKVSPDLTRGDVDAIVGVGEEYVVNGYTATNTSTIHDPKYITREMPTAGASGDAVWDASVRVQEYFADRVGKDVKLIACGGINSVERAKERIQMGYCEEIQVFTPLVLKGTGFLKELRNPLAA